MTLEERPSFPACSLKTHNRFWDAPMIKPLCGDTADTSAERRPDINKWCGTMNPWRLEAASERHLTVSVCDTGGRQWTEREERRINTQQPERNFRTQPAAHFSFLPIRRRKEDWVTFSPYCCLGWEIIWKRQMTGIRDECLVPYDHWKQDILSLYKEKLIQRW